MFTLAAKTAEDYSNTEVLLYALLGIAVVISVLTLLYLAVKLISKAAPAVNSPAEPQPLQGSQSVVPQQPISEGEPQTPVLPLSPPQVTLIDTDEPTAAILMAIVSERSGISLHQLEFKSIRLLSEVN